MNAPLIFVGITTAIVIAWTVAIVTGPRVTTGVVQPGMYKRT